MTQLLLSSLRLPALALTALLALPMVGLAQDDDGTITESTSNSGGISVRILSIAGDSPDTVGTIWLGLAACRAGTNGADVEFRLDQVPDRETFDIYVGPNCNTPEARDGDDESDCELIKSESIDGRTQDVIVELGARDIIGAAVPGGDCSASSSKPELWFIAVDNSGTSEAVTTADYGKLTLNVDTDPPDAPTDVRGGRAQNQIPVTWDTSDEVNSFKIYVDSGEGTGEVPTDASTDPIEPDGGSSDGGTQSGSGATNAECGTGALTEGASAEGLNVAKEERSPTATGTKLSSADIDGTVAAVAVVAVDEAGNESTLSKSACVYVVPTTGLKDLYEMNNGEYPQGCPCAATGPAQLDAAWPIGLALSVLAYRRRRRS